jgi:3-oxoacyl-[acyl-carrier protein] reductase
MSLQGKTALITGGSRGIGAAIAARLAEDGAGLVIGYSGNAQAAETVAAEVRSMGRRTVAIQADIRDPAAVPRLFAEAVAAFGRVDIVVANAGVELIDTPFTDYSEAQHDLVFDINVKGTFFTLQEPARTLPDGGRIIFISSNTTRLLLPGFAVYGASKLAPHYFVQVLAKELGPRRITVNSVIPGATRAAGVFTDSGDDDPDVRELTARTPLGRLGTPDDTAHTVALLASDAAAFITGQHVTVDGCAAIS